MLDTPDLMPLQPKCSCEDCATYDTAAGCAASPWQSTGPCRMAEFGCTCYGTEVDGGLCEGCYIGTK